MSDIRGLILSGGSGPLASAVAAAQSAVAAAQAAASAALARAEVAEQSLVMEKARASARALTVGRLVAIASMVGLDWARLADIERESLPMDVDIARGIVTIMDADRRLSGPHSSLETAGLGDPDYRGVYPELASRLYAYVREALGETEADRCLGEGVRPDNA